MSLRNTQQRKFDPHGVTDALDEGGAFPGACQSIVNLIPDARQKDRWVCRPAAIRMTAFAGFSNPGKISALKIIGNVAYGMIGSGLNVGLDQPFAFNLVAQTFITVTGITSANTPTTPSSSGAWVPPTMALVASRLIVTHPGYPNGLNFFGWFDLSTPGAPVWNGGNTTGTLLPIAPVAVEQYSDRAYFAVNITGGAGNYASLYFTDTGTLNLTSATQILTFGDNTPITALAGLPYQNVLGGVIQALMVFKGSANGVFNIYQVTGDASNTQSVQSGTTPFANQLIVTSLQVNALNVATTTLAPNTIASVPDGLLFVAPDGLRKIDWNAKIGPPIGADGQGVNAPFFVVPVPSRMAGAGTATVFRISFQNATALGNPTQEYWFDMVRQMWSGPHSFPFDLIASWGNTFVGAPTGINASLWLSDFEQELTSTFVENGHQLTWSLTTCEFADNGQMNENAQLETEVYLALPGGGNFIITAFDENQSNIGSFTYSVTGTTAVWGSFTWGQANWGAPFTPYRPRRVDWAQSLVYRRLSLGLQGTSAQPVSVGCMYMREEQLGYVQQIA